MTNGAIFHKIGEAYVPPVDRTPCQHNCRAAAGTIVEIGPHAELLAKGGYYSQLYKLQFKNQE